MDLLDIASEDRKPQRQLLDTATSGNVIIIIILIHITLDTATSGINTFIIIVTIMEINHHDYHDYHDN